MTPHDTRLAPAVTEIPQWFQWLIVGACIGFFAACGLIGFVGVVLT